jgi:two-component system, cell cycle sensor histidine kinase and response regulator CckA
MLKTAKSFALRYGFGLLVFVLIIALATGLRRLAIAIDLGFLIILALIAVSWFWGKGPGLMVLILFEFVSIMFTYKTQPERLFTAKYIFAQVNVITLLGILVVLINGRRMSERRIREQREWLQVTLSSIGDAVIATDLKGEISFMNPAAEALTGWTSSQATKMSLGEVLRNVDKEADKSVENSIAELADLEPGLVTKAKDLTLVSRDGTEKFISYNRSPIRNQAGQTTGVVLVLHDMTERKQTEEALRHTEEQLIQAQKMEAVGRLAGGVAHDFNNLLTAIIGYSQLIQGQLEPTTPMRHDIDEICTAGQRAAALTSQLLAFSRKQVLQPKILDLNTIVANTSKMLSRLIGEDIRFRTTLDPGLKQVKADPGQIEQVLMNLAVNARDAMPNGGSLSIETANVYLDERYAEHHVDVRPGHHVMLVVSDSGCGMDSKTLSNIFEPFFTTKEQGKGTGLGLATVYGIVKQSGGHIWVYSEPDKGTTFKVYLPQVEEQSSSVTPPIQPEVLPLGTETVLLAEDELQVREFSSRVLRRLGYNVLEASNGQEALIVAKQTAGTIDILLTDVVMPQIGGKPLSEKLTLERPEIKVLFLSGYTADSIVHHGVLEEGVAFLHKPFTAGDLARKVREVLDTRVPSVGSPEVVADSAKKEVVFQ